MEFLDFYDENGNHLGKESRDIVHAKGLWHKTIHCWLYDKLGNVYFQQRITTDGKINKMYTTASGHVSAGETLSQAFFREVKEEIGIDVDIKKSRLVEMVVWKMDLKKKDGSMMHDRAFANVYANEIGTKLPKFCFTDGEVLGVIKVNAKDALELLRKENGSMNAIKIDAKNAAKEIKISMEDFLINPHEIGLVKYGRVLQFIIEETGLCRK